MKELLANKAGLGDIKFLAGANVFDNINSSVSQLTGYAQGISWGIFILMCVIAGIAWAFGGQGSQWAKGTLGKVIIGVAVVSLATAIITTVRGVAGGGF